ncbi:MAG: hypothetical protein HY889_04940 [Deltaproteobacteria bacterium]|nr:hypothetical protein [Deltaproteobacteria bacterium]
MKSYTGLSNIRKFLISLSIIFVIALVDYISFVSKARQIEMYDDLNFRLSSARVSIAKLEYILDMFVVARRFETTTVDIIKHDIDKLDENINEALNRRQYGRILKNNAKLAEGMASISTDWQTIKTEVKRLSHTLPQEEIMLLHNAVDVNTVLVTEKTDRLLSIVAESRKELFSDTKSQALETIIGFALLTLLSSLIFHKKILSPIYRARTTAKRVSSGEASARFDEDKFSAIGLFSEELNRMLDSLIESQVLKDRKNAALAEESGIKTFQMEALSQLMASAGRSISQNDFFNSAVREAVQTGSADGSAVYLLDGDTLRLKASAGFDDNFVREVSSIRVSEMKRFERAEAARSFKVYGEAACDGYRLFKDRGFESLVCAPILYNNETTGFLYAAFREKEAPNTAFFEALALSTGALTGHINLFQKEHGQKKFLERVLNQTPFGVAVFDRNGVCLMLNTVLRKYLGVDNRFNPIGEYSIFNDDVFAGEGMVPSIKKSYDGFSTEFIINYNPSLVKKYFFSGTPRKLRVKSIPLYDAGGEISNIVLLYEDLSEFTEETANSSES